MKKVQNPASDVEPPPANKTKQSEETDPQHAEAAWFGDTPTRPVGVKGVAVAPELLQGHARSRETEIHQSREIDRAENACRAIAAETRSTIGPGNISKLMSQNARRSCRPKRGRGGGQLVPS